MRIGYARVSTDDQTLDLQRDALKRAKCRDIYEEHASGKNTARPQLEACLKSLREGDTLIVWRLDRLGRSLGDLIHLTHEFKARGVGFASLTEQIDTRSPTGQLVFHVFGALAEFEPDPRAHARRSESRPCPWPQGGSAEEAQPQRAEDDPHAAALE
jgi:DNA invertase Pin-like site-specific DNA recombinase